MIITAKESNAITSGNFTSHDFGIGDPVLVLDILRNRLYKNPIRIIVQEYTANAKDAHVEAGMLEKAIRIQAPNSLKPELIIEDFGKSMTENEISTIFTQYGVSTKRKDDKFIGGFGIGSKSGWSYTDSYSVVTRTLESGIVVERTYCAYIDATGIGKISLLSTKKDRSSKATGTRIIIPVKSGDMSRFNEEIRKLYAYFTFPMEVVGLQDLVKEEVLEAGELRYYKDKYYNEGVIVEGVRYTCDMDELKRLFPESAPEINRIVNFKMVPCLSNSDVDVSPDRSSVQQTKRNADALRAWVEEFSQREMKFVRKQFGKITNAKELIHEWSRLYSSYKRDYLEDYIEEKFPNISMQKIKGIYNECEVIQGELFNDKKHFVYSRIDDEAAFPEDSTLVVYDKRKCAWNSKLGGIKEVRKYIEELLGYKPMLERKKGGRGKIPTFYVPSYSYSSRAVLTKMRLKEVEDTCTHYALKDKMNNIDYGDGVFRSVSYRQIPDALKKTLVIVAKSFKDFMEDELELTPAIEAIKAKKADIIKHHFDKKTKTLILGANGYLPYEFSEFKEFIPEVKELYTLHGDYQKLTIHPWYRIAQEAGILDDQNFNHYNCKNEVDAITKKYPLLFGGKRTQEYKDHVKKYIDSVNEAV